MRIPSTDRELFLFGSLLLEIFANLNANPRCCSELTQEEPPSLSAVKPILRLRRLQPRPVILNN